METKNSTPENPSVTYENVIVDIPHLPFHASPLLTQSIFLSRRNIHFFVNKDDESYSCIHTRLQFLYQLQKNYPTIRIFMHARENWRSLDLNIIGSAGEKVLMMSLTFADSFLMQMCISAAFADIGWTCHVQYLDKFHDCEQYIVTKETANQLRWIWIVKILGNSICGIKEMQLVWTHYILAQGAITTKRQTRKAGPSKRKRIHG